MLVSSIFTVTNSSLLLLAHSGNAFAIQGAAQNPIQPGIDEINSGSQPTTEKLSLPDGYTAEGVCRITLPTSVTFDANGSMYIAESGYIYGELRPQPRILKVDQNGNVSVFVDRLLSLTAILSRC
jgi:hypothetical protein